METAQGQGEPLRVWCIYFNPSDFPGLYVVREWHVLRDKEPMPVNVARTRHTLVQARELIPLGLVALARCPSDDPAIVETWL